MAADQGEEPVPTAAEMEAFYKAVPKIYSSVLIVDIGKADAIQLRKIKQLLEYEHGDRALMRSYPESEVLLRRHAAFTGNPDLDLSGVLPLLKVSEYHRILFLRRADGDKDRMAEELAESWDPKLSNVLYLERLASKMVWKKEDVEFIGTDEDKGEFVGADVAPFDMVVRAGDTGLDQSYYDLFEKFNIPTKVNEEGKLEVVAGKAGLVVAPKYEEMDPSLNTLLQKLVDPFNTGIVILAIYNNSKGSWVVPPSVASKYTHGPSILQTHLDFARDTGIDPDKLFDFMNDGEEEEAAAAAGAGAGGDGLDQEGLSDKGTQ